jgi:hypothetical protein
MSPRNNESYKSPINKNFIDNGKQMTENKGFKDFHNPIENNEIEN